MIFLQQLSCGYEFPALIHAWIASAVVLEWFTSTRGMSAGNSYPHSSCCRKVPFHKGLLVGSDGRKNLSMVLLMSRDIRIFLLNSWKIRQIDVFKQFGDIQMKKIIKWRHNMWEKAYKVWPATFWRFFFMNLKSSANS